MPSKSQSILLGASVTLVLLLLTSFLGAGGGQVQGILSSAVCCLAAVGGAALAVWHYTSTHRLTIPAGTGAGLGALTVAAGFAVSYVIGLLLQTLGVLPTQEEALAQARRQMVEDGMTEEQVAQALGMVEMFQGPMGIVISLVVCAVVGALAGAIAASVFKKGPVEEI